jgi:hypothetical protein
MDVKSLLYNTYREKQPNLKLKTQPKQLVDSLQLAFCISLDCSPKVKVIVVSVDTVM